MPEILAPVGSFKSLKAAIYSKADAVYLGMSRFNARKNAENFNENNIKEAVDLCHLHGVKVYITFNTCIKNDEFEDFENQVKICVDANVDAFIVTDLGTLDVFRKYNIPLHASTQIGIHNYEGAKIAKELGFSRVVLARETLEEDIVKIKTLGIEIEYFIHGALCVAFSGSCLLSSFMTGCSGNRGLCKQPCRLIYTSSLNNKKAYYLSPSDQCLIDKVDKLSKLGVDSFKIEGRLKAPHYVGETVKQYKAALNGNLKKGYLSSLKRAYNRGDFTKGYNSDKTQNIMSIDIPGNKGENIGYIKYISGSTLTICSNREIKKNDGLKIIYNNREVGGFLVDNVEKSGDCLYKIKTNKKYPIKSLVNLTLDSNMVKEYDLINLKLPIDIKYKMIAGEKFEIHAKSKGYELISVYDNVEFSNNTSLSKEYVDKKLIEIGDSAFFVNKIEGIVGENVFYPASKIKKAKRDIIDKMVHTILFNYSKNKQKFSMSYKPLNLRNDIELKDKLVEISNLDLLNNLNLNEITPILNIRNILSNNRECIIKNVLKYNNIEKICLKLPKILRGSDMNVVKEFISLNLNSISSILVENISHIEICREFNLVPILGIGMNIYNDKIMQNLGIEHGVNSLELNKNELNKSYFTYVFGKINLMILTHCPIQLNLGSNCSNCLYKDDFYYNNFKIEREKINYCYFNLINNKILNLTDVVTNNKRYYNLDLNILNKNIVDNINNDEKIIIPNSTSGHYYSHVE